jgi:hypothetical protein
MILIVHFLSSPFDRAWCSVFSCSYTDMGCPVTDIISVKEGPNRIGVSSFRNIMLSSFLEYWTMDKVQKPNNSGSIGLD